MQDTEYLTLDDPELNERVPTETQALTQHPTNTIQTSACTITSVLSSFYNLRWIILNRQLQLAFQKQSDQKRDIPLKKCRRKSY